MPNDMSKIVEVMPSRLKHNIRNIRTSLACVLIIRPLHKSLAKVSRLFMIVLPYKSLFYNPIFFVFLILPLKFLSGTLFLIPLLD